MDIKGLISKINDRNIQRKRESGFTSYAMASVALLILYHAFETYNNISFKEFTIEKLLIVGIVGNIFLYTHFILSFYNDQSSTSVKIFHKNKEIPFHKQLPVALLFFSPIFVFIYSSILWLNNGYSENAINTYLIIALSVNILLLIVFSAVFINAFKEYRNEFHIQSRNELDIRHVILFVIFGTLTMYSLYVLIALKFTFSKHYIIDFSISICIVFSIIDKILTASQDDVSSDKLEQFEQEIVLNKLTDEEIIHRLKSDFLGIFLDEWISNKILEIDNHLKRFNDNKKIELEKLKNELTNIDKNIYPHEYNGRAMSYKKALLDEVEGMHKFFNDKLNEVKKISNKKMSEDERKNINLLIDKLKSDFNITKELLQEAKEIKLI